MAGEVSAQIKLQIPAGGQPAPPVGPSLGQHGVNIMEFCKQFNAKTRKMGDSIILVIIMVQATGALPFIMKTLRRGLLAKAAGIIKDRASRTRIRWARSVRFPGSGNRAKEVVGLERGSILKAPSRLFRAQRAAWASPSSKSVQSEPGGCEGEVWERR